VHGGWHREDASLQTLVPRTGCLVGERTPSTRPDVVALQPFDDGNSARGSALGSALAASSTVTSNRWLRTAKHGAGGWSRSSSRAGP